MGPHRRLKCDGVNVTTEYSSLNVNHTDWRFRVTSQPVYNRVTGPRHRLDVRMHILKRVSVHGLIAQAYFRPRRDGAMDSYPSEGEYTTHCLAEGAIDGNATDYIVASPYDPNFRFSQFFHVPVSDAEFVKEHEAIATSDGWDEDDEDL